MCILPEARNNISAYNSEEMWSVGTARGQVLWSLVGSDVNGTIRNSRGMLQRRQAPLLKSRVSKLRLEREEKRI